MQIVMPDTIQLKNIRYLKEDYGFGEEDALKTIDADVFVNGVKFSGFCELNTFFLDSHCEDNRERTLYYQSILPAKNQPSGYDFRLNSDLFKFNKEWLKRIKQTTSFQRKKLKKAFKKARNALLLNPNYQKERVWRNKFFQGVKKFSVSYLDSCSCGIAGCSGIHSGVTIKRTKNAFIYEAKESDGYHKGILGSKKMKLVVPVSDIIFIRKQLTEFKKQNQ